MEYCGKLSKQHKTVNELPFTDNESGETWEKICSEESHAYVEKLQILDNEMIKGVKVRTNVKKQKSKNKDSNCTMFRGRDTC
ncbi:hypothetical protein H5410_048390 [Solanum commersonii]|uniref:Uncharacterized protein n=1 Tax=Solanum commersonii TaxID=4109 RepID=A0A9J5XKY6_SOLCO|nr:hypothetical protein H5410_048390 [Solanum commersonii]